MTRYGPGLRALALCYAFLAGFVDAIGFLDTGGWFVSFMSGNSTRLAVGIATVTAAGPIAIALIATFVFGVFLNALLGAQVGPSRRKIAAASGVAIPLIMAASCETAGWPVATIGLLCLAMGASNTIFQRDGEVSIGVTYMTGTLVKLGYRLADAVRGGDRAGWTPYLMLWLALVGGGISGAAGFSWSPILSLWIAAGSGGLLIFATRCLTSPSVHIPRARRT